MRRGTGSRGTLRSVRSSAGGGRTNVQYTVAGETSGRDQNEAKRKARTKVKENQSPHWRIDKRVEDPASNVPVIGTADKKQRPNEDESEGLRRIPTTGAGEGYQETHCYEPSRPQVPGSGHQSGVHHADDHQWFGNPHVRKTRAGRIRTFASNAIRFSGAGPDFDHAHAPEAVLTVLPYILGTTRTAKLS